jgi:hypothetical protein
MLVNPELLCALDGQVDKPRRSSEAPDELFSHPMLTADSVERLGMAGKYGGPTLGVATALYDTVTAKTFHDGCVAAISGSTGIAGGYATGTLASGLVTGLGNPELVPVVAMGGDMLGGWTFGYVGGIIGNIVCPG